ncbi:hypothetical protein [Tardiphaga sp.]|uniref:hypothetical protein n=1 Tax=Tardiphaga sp. TaxID=1926292 RepID=UPI00261DD185|nr:hypothetical protein [Tardiphaga sp.]MDB5620531.1 hypothetical protein [Tardiphaga sp.]
MIDLRDRKAKLPGIFDGLYGVATEPQIVYQQREVIGADRAAISADSQRLAEEMIAYRIGDGCLGFRPLPLWLPSSHAANASDVILDGN